MVQSNQHINIISSWRYNSCSHHYANWKAKFKSEIPSKLRPRRSQARDPRHTNKSAKISNIFILNIIPSSHSSTRANEKRQWDILRISYIRIYDNCALFSSTSSQIYTRDKRKQVKWSLFNEFLMDRNIFLSDSVNPKIGQKLCVCEYK